MTELTQQSYWNQVWQADGERGIPPVDARSRTYNDYVFHEILLDRYLPRSAGRKIVEIGSAPGTVVVQLARRFGYVPYGVEYTAAGAALNRTVFAENGIDPENVIEADFFSEEFLARWRAEFDVVISRGFIEHFTEVADVVGRHTALLRPGGDLVIMIPRFCGLYGAWKRRVDPEDLARHNLDIMEKDNFARAFEGHGLTPLYCGYVGGLSVKRFALPGDSPLARAQRRFVYHAAQATDLLMRRLLAPPGLESPLLSPYLLYIGRKAWSVPVTS